MVGPRADVGGGRGLGFPEAPPEAVNGLDNGIVLAYTFITGRWRRVVLLGAVAYPAIEGAWARLQGVGAPFVPVVGAFLALSVERVVELLLG